MTGQQRPRGLGWRTDLMILALQGAQVSHEPGHLVIRSPGNPLHHWGNFVLLDTPPAEQELVDLVKGFRALFPGSDHVLIGIDAADGDAAEAGEAAFTALALGLEEVHHTVLAASPGSMATGPGDGVPGVELRRLESDEDFAALVELGMELVGDLDPELFRAYLTRSVEEARDLCVAGQALWWGGFSDAGALVASAGIVHHDGLARFQEVHVHEAFRRRGVASTLVRSLLRDAAATWGEAPAADGGQPEDGAASADNESTAERGLLAVMVAEADSPAERVYRSLGFTDAGTQVAFYSPGT